MVRLDSGRRQSMSRARKTCSRDVFISYSGRDAEWVRTWLLPRLEAAGTTVRVDFRDFRIGLPSQVNMERAVESASATVLVLTPNWVQSEWTQFEALMVYLDHPLNLRQRVLPILLKKCKIPRRLRILTYLDFTRAEERALQFGRLVEELYFQRRHRHRARHEARDKLP